MNTPKVSMIIPVYNAELYIEQCLDSLLEQTFSDYEIICIDDGSQDHSYEILKEYEKRDRRITVIAQKNQYAGVARNSGMERAKGKYLLFLDADDFFCNDMLEQVVDKAEEDHAEILVFDSYRFDDMSQKVMNDSWKVLSKSLFGNGVKSASELSDVIYRFTTSAPWNKLFLREYIAKNNLKFQPLRRTNDLFFVYSALSCADRIGILDKKLVYYRVNNSASLQGSLDDTPVSFASALCALKDFLIERNVWETFQNSFNNMAATACINNLTSLKSEKVYKQLCKTLKREIIPNLGIEVDEINGQLKKAIETGETLVIYGAGAVAAALIRYLLICCGYRTDKIKVAVTATANNMSSIYNIEIKQIDALCLDQENVLMIIAVSEDSQQNEIENYLHRRNFKNIFKIGYGGIIGLLKNLEYEKEMKYLIFGTGDYYNRYKKWFKHQEIAALLDNSKQKQYAMIDGIKVLPPEEGIKLQYDIIVILSFYVKQMKQQLISLGVSEDKIYHFYELNQLFAQNRARIPVQYYLNAEEIVKSKKHMGIKILLMSTDLTLGGPSIALFHAAVTLKKQGYTVVYASMWDGALKKKLIEQNIPVVVDENLPISTMKQTEWVNAFSLVICNTLNFHVFLSERDTAIPVIWWFHDARFFYDGVSRQVIERISLKNLKAVSVGPVPEAAVKEFLPDLECEELLYGVDDVEIAKMKECGDNVMRFITIGFLEDIKGQDILLKAIKELPDHIRCNCEFYIVGHNKTLFGEKMQKESAEIRELIFTGSVDRKTIHELLSSSSILICPSKQDAMPTVAAEAMMHSVPCVVSDVVGTAAYITDGMDGFVFQNENVQMLVEKIEWCVANRDVLDQIGKNARKLYEKHFSMMAFEKRFLEIVQDVLNGNRK